MIEFASNYCPSNKYSNLNFLKQDINEIDFENHFDKIVSFSTLHWILDQEKVLKAIYKALVPKGKVCIHTYGQGKMNVTDVCEVTINTKKWKPYFPSHVKGRIFLTKQEFHNLLKQSGFKKISIKESYSETLLPNKQALFDFVKPLLNSIQHLSKQQQQEFTEEVVARITDMAASSQKGEIFYQTLNLQATCIK